MRAYANQQKTRGSHFSRQGADSRADRRRSRQQIAPCLSLAVIRANLVTEKWTGRCLVACLGRHGAVRAALHTQNSALLSRGPCGIIMHGLDGERQAATAKSLLRVLMLLSAVEDGLRLNLPLGRGPARHCFAAGLPSEAGCNKGEDRTAVSAVVVDGGSNPLSLSLGCRRHHGRREGGRNVVQGLRLRRLRRCGHKRLSKGRSVEESGSDGAMGSQR